MIPLSVLGIVSYKVFPAQMGGQKYIAAYYSELSKHANLVLAVSKDNQVDRFSPYKVLPFLFNHWYGPLNIIYIYKLCQIIRKEKINVILIDHTYFGWIGVILQFLTHKKLVIKSANIESLRFKDMGRVGWRLYDQYEGWVHRNAMLNFFITDEEKKLAINRWNLLPATCETLLYGVTLKFPVSKSERARCRNLLIQEHNVSPHTKLFLFNGTLDYLPNTDALYVITQELIFKMESSLMPYKIFICGNRISSEWEKVLRENPNIIYKGYVKDIDKYYMGTDCFICPITLGTGIKTKIVEAIAHGLPVIACRKSGEGFTDIELEKQLHLIDNYNWNAFADAMLKLDYFHFSETPAAFFSTFNWSIIVQKSILSLQK